MRRFFTFISGAFVSASLFAGGLVTNTNQSASWVRLPARDASTSIDAVYFNPAGLMKLNNGFHFSLSNQTIFQNKEVENFYTGPGGAFGLNESLYKGKVSAPVFPSVYAAYKMDRLAFSLGVNPIGGGGGAVFDKGLPSFELTPSDLVPALASQGATAYKLDAYFEGTSVYFGFQGGISYKLNDVISIAAGARYMNATNTYMGHLRNIELKMPTGLTRADLIMSGIASQYTTGASTATNVATQTTALVDGGAGSLTLAQAEAATIITADQRQLLETALEGFGLETTGTISEADAGLKGKAQEFTAYSAQYTATASLLGDQEADVEQTGYGITPFFSVNISPTDRINIGIKYEMATEMTITNKTAKDFKVGYTPTGTAITMFPDGEEIRNDMPAMLSMGVDLGLTEKLNVAAGFHYYFDKPANYGRKLNGVYVENEKIIDNNYYEAAAGLQYKLNDYLLLSAGYLYSKTGVNDDYQSDLTYSLTSHTGGIGGAINVLENLRINLGFAYTYYLNGEKTINHLFSPTATTITAKETYFKDTMIISAGIDFNF